MLSMAISSNDLVRILKSHISPVTRVSVGVRIGLYYDRLIIDNQMTHMYEVQLPINTGLTLGLDENIIKEILSIKDRDLEICELHPQLFNNPPLLKFLAGKMEWYNNQTKLLRRNVSIDDLSDHEDFQNKTTNLKAADGCRFVFFQGNDLYDRYIVPVFAGFPNLSKGDTMGLNIYRSSPYEYIVEYFIHKKKIKATYHAFSRQKDMDHPIIRF